MGNFKLDEKTYEYQTLKKKYGGFSSPNIKIYINNTDVSKTLKISDIEVENSIYKLGYFSFSVVNAFDNKKKDFLFDDILQVGQSIKIDMGYMNKFETVFIGLITSISYNISHDGPIIVVGGFDKSFLLMKGSKSAIWQNKKHSDIVKSIAGKYKLSTVLSQTTVSYDTVVQNQMTDYEYITYLANLNAFEFFTIGSNLYFREINKEKTPLITLTMFDNIMSANITADIGDVIGGTTVRGYNIKKEETEVSAKSIVSVNNSGKNGVSVLNSLDSTNLYHYIYEPNIDKQAAEKLAKSYLEKTAMNYVSGEIKIIGIPEIISGRYIAVNGIKGTQSKQLLYAKSVKHIIDEDGYTTIIEVGGNSL